MFTLSEESKIQRNPNAPDVMTHATVFMLSPANLLKYRGLSKVDVKVLKILGKRTNVLLCIGKCDQLSKKEITDLRVWVRRDTREFQLPVVILDDEAISESGSETAAEEDDSTASYERVPFALFASEMDDVEADDFSHVGVPVQGGAKVFGRDYPHGVADIAIHSDFHIFKEQLFRFHTELRTVTRETLYENWRSERLQAATQSQHKKAASLSAIEKPAEAPSPSDDTASANTEPPMSRPVSEARPSMEEPKETMINRDDYPRRESLHADIAEFDPERRSFLRRASFAKIRSVMQTA